MFLAYRMVRFGSVRLSCLVGREIETSEGLVGLQGLRKRVYAFPAVVELQIHLFRWQWQTEHASELRASKTKATELLDAEANSCLLPCLPQYQKGGSTSALYKSHPKLKHGLKKISA